MNKNLVVLLVIGFGALGVYYFLNSAPSAPVSQTEATEEMHAEDTHGQENEDHEGSEVHVVTYTNAGFGESTLTIAAGDSVTFMNNSSQPLRVAFGDHEDHDESPDHKEHPTISEGMSDTVVFPTAGTYEYHNHHADEHHGTVTVN